MSGNPVAVAAGRATLALLQSPGFYDALGRATQTLVGGLQDQARAAGRAFSAQAVGGMFGLYFSEKAPTSYAQVMESDREAFNRFFHAMLARGVYLKHIARHLLGLFAGERGGRAFRQILSEGAHKPGADWSLIEQAIAVTESFQGERVDAA